jgi:CBS domain-containing protein
MSEPSRPKAATPVADDFMTASVVAVTADTTVQSVARVLLERRIGAVPVVDETGAPVGMASDGDLLGRRRTPERGDWWLEMLAREQASSDALPVDELAAARERPVREVMNHPLVTIAPLTAIPEITRLLREHRIKRLPVLHEGKMVGIVTRADLLVAIERLREATSEAPEQRGALRQLVQSLFAGKTGPSPTERLATIEAEAAAEALASAAVVAAGSEISAGGFRDLVVARQQTKVDDTARVAHAAALERQQQVKAVLNQRVNAEFWRQLMVQARVAASNGEIEMLLLRFPARVCSDGGREIDVAEPGWMDTLRGEAAEIYARWEKELKPRGFGLKARVESLEDGMISDIGLVLTWGG